jgi:hypothetical protein
MGFVVSYLKMNLLLSLKVPKNFKCAFIITRFLSRSVKQLDNCILVCCVV